MPRSSDLFGHHDPFVTVQEDSQDKGEEEQDGVHDAQGPRCLQHGTILVEMEGPR